MANTTIIVNGTVLTCDASNRCGRYAIVVQNGRVHQITERIEPLLKEFADATIVDASNTLIVPGLVNAHFHGESFLLRDLTRGMHFSLWSDEPRFQQALTKILHPASAEDVRRMYQGAYLAHLKSGTTCVGEFGPSFGEENFRKMLEGIEKSGLTAVVSLQNWDQIRALHALGAKRPNAVINLGKEEGFTVYSFEQLSKTAKEMNTPVLAHVAETRDDVEIVRKNFQRGCLELLDSYNLLRAITTLVHANYATEDNAKRLKEINGTVVVCARSTAKKQTGYPALRSLAKLNVRIAMGTDWDSTDMIEEMRFVHQLPLVVAGLRPFSAMEVVRMATINGAHALGVANELGSIEKGKRADFTFLNASDIRLPVAHSRSSCEDWAQLLVEHLSTADIRDVMVNGEFNIRDRSVTSSFEKEITDEFRAVHSKYFPQSASIPIHIAGQDQPTTNVLPFLSETRASHEQAEVEGFEAGHPASTKSAPIIEITERTSETSPLSKSTRELVKPELPKNTRRVFGEDEEF